MLLLPKKNKLIFYFFDKYICYITKNHFHKIIFDKIPFQNQKSILLLANHFSWWDGFVYYWLNKIYFRKKFHLLMNEENYKTVKFIKYLGGIGIPFGSRNTVKTLDYCQQILSEPENILIFFPQGEIESNHIEKLQLKKGVERLVNPQVQTLFCAAFTDYFSHQKNNLFCYLSENQNTETSILANFQQHYQQALAKHKELKHA